MNFNLLNSINDQGEYFLITLGKFKRVKVQSPLVCTRQSSGESGPYNAVKLFSVNDMNSSKMANHKIFEFEELEFIAVTAYQVKIFYQMLTRKKAFLRIK